MNLIEISNVKLTMNVFNQFDLGLLKTANKPEVSELPVNQPRVSIEIIDTNSQPFSPYSSNFS